MAGKSRSPNYPALSLVKALELARKLWDAEKRTAVTHQTAAADLGYSSLSGPARVAIGALRQYGLITKPDAGHLAVSDLAIRALHGTPEEQQVAQVEAAKSPQLFRELLTTHSDASEAAIRSHLVTKRGFANDGAAKAAKSFRVTQELAKAGSSGYTDSLNEKEPEDMQGNESGLNPRDVGNLGGKGPDGSGMMSLSVPYARGTITVQVRVTGETLRPFHLARVRKYLELAEADWESESKD